MKHVSPERLSSNFSEEQLSLQYRDFQDQNFSKYFSPSKKKNSVQYDYTPPPIEQMQHMD
jgi:hypothetical protein